MRKHEMIGNVRGIGLLQTIELPQDRISRDLFPAGPNPFKRLTETLLHLLDRSLIELQLSLYFAVYFAA